MTLLRVDGAAPRMSKIPEEYIRNTQQASSNTYDLAKINEVHSLGHILAKWKIHCKDHIQLKVS